MYSYAQSAGAAALAQASYTLRVADERGYDAAATGGYFYGQNSMVNFALYSPAAYTSLADGEWLFLVLGWLLAGSRVERLTVCVLVQGGNARPARSRRPLREPCRTRSSP